MTDRSKNGGEDITKFCGSNLRACPRMLSGPVAWWKLILLWVLYMSADDSVSGGSCIPWVYLEACGIVERQALMFISYLLLIYLL